MEKLGFILSSGYFKIGFCVFKTEQELPILVCDLYKYRVLAYPQIKVLYFEVQ